MWRRGAVCTGTRRRRALIGQLGAWGPPPRYREPLWIGRDILSAIVASRTPGFCLFITFHDTGKVADDNEFIDTRRNYRVVFFINFFNGFSFRS